MKDKIEAIMSQLVGKTSSGGPLTGIDISEQFRPSETTEAATFRNLNAAFLLLLCHESHPTHSEAKSFIENLKRQPDWEGPVRFYQEGLSLILKELEEQYRNRLSLKDNLDRLVLAGEDSHKALDLLGSIDNVWKVFFPEGVSLFANRKDKIESLRKKRRIQITRLKMDPIQDPASEILFTSNLLFTLPSSSVPITDLSFSQVLKRRLEAISREPQLFWYDHPIQLGVEMSKNEAVYGIRELDRAVAFEKDRGTLAQEQTINLLLSLSVTHGGLRDIAKACLEEMLQGTEGIRHVRVYALSEDDTGKLLDKVLVPGVRHYLGAKDQDLLYKVFGTDGEYGRHYSLLKAMAAFWQVFLDPQIKGTFKIDLDQVFPQEHLVSETGASALEHLMTPLWGAEGVDHEGGPVELGMIAGALVNSEDIGTSLFTPDVTFPEPNIRGDEWIFFSRLPQALSTEAEMMLRYGNGLLDGQKECAQRFHVTGGTCGILVDSLRRHRPFTPGFIGRAEDQAYLLSVLFENPAGHLRYLHKEGLIMRHDKDGFAAEAIQSAATGKLIGDYLRILLFSFYAKGLPWPMEKTKDLFGPFAGCFISHIPFTVVFLRLALKGAMFFRDGKQTEGLDFLDMGTRRLHKVIRELVSAPDSLKEGFLEEKRGWEIFYDLLDSVEEGLSKGDPFAVDLRDKAREIIQETELALN
ncbi:MAG: hypothetical protein V2J25_04205 [Desulfatiglans sp.]|jgi:hypothetical protein|nr:hypothetical protein [Desulfatiglans sp.]